MSTPTYRLSTWDPVDDTAASDFDWNLRYSGLTRWQLRPAIREARSMGYSEFSFLVECEG